MDYNHLGWRFAALIHNLSLENAIITKYVSIVSAKDSIVFELRKVQPGLSYLLDRFTDQYGRKVDPCLLLIKNDVLHATFDNDAIVAFRNIVAVSVIIKAWQESFVMKVPNSILRYSDYFDFYPIRLSKDGDLFLLQSPSGQSIDESINFSGQTSPELVRMNQRGTLCDEILFTGLIQIWEKFYVKKMAMNWQNKALFRSLEMVYHASSIPVKNKSSVYDYGSSLSLWVSAMEILAHARKLRRFGRKDVIELIGKTPFNARKLRHRYYSITYEKKSNTKKAKIYSANLAQKLCNQIYDARNDFMHGNPVSMSKLFPFRDQHLAPLTSYAPLIFKSALLSAFCGQFSLSLDNCTTGKYIDIRNFEDALLTSKR